MFPFRWLAWLVWAPFVCAAPVAMEKLLNERVPMRDGVHLDTHVFHPVGGGRYPAILIRTPYDKGEDLLPSYNSFIQHGFAVVLQDVRGRYRSEGVFNALEQEGPDGYDTLNWIARQPWSDGKVGMTGGSYLGIAQWKVAVLNNPHLKAIFPIVSGWDDYLDRYYSTGGAIKLGHRLLWLSENLLTPGMPRPKFEEYVDHLPLRTADRIASAHTLPIFQRVLDHPSYDSFWRNLSVREKIDQVHIPVFAVGGWYDNYVESDLEAFSALSRLATRGGGMQRVLIGPWPHNMSIRFPGVDFGPDSASPIRTYQIEWFEHWLKNPTGPELKGTSAPEWKGSAGLWHNERSEVTGAPVEIFVMGVNRWRDEQEWPLARTHYTPLYLTSKGHANGLNGDGELKWNPPRREFRDEFTDDPTRPVPTMGGAICCNPKVLPWGPMDQRAVEARADVLVFTTPALKREVEVTGPVRAFLYASTSARDTDFTAKLVDVFPSGEARNISDGILRLRYRNGLDKPTLASPGAIYPITIDVGVTSNVFLKGHRIRVEIASTNFPHFDRNPNTGRTVADETVLKKADQTIYHGPRFESRIILPVIPPAGELATGHIRGVEKKSPSALSFHSR